VKASSDLCEISPIFSDPERCDPLLLGGDFNTFTGHMLPGHAERDRITLERIEGYGLVDRLAERAKGPLKGCPCQKLSQRRCRHTLTRYIPGDDTPYREDYLFASRALAGSLDKCFALEPKSGSLTAITRRSLRRSTSRRRSTRSRAGSRPTETRLTP